MPSRRGLLRLVAIGVGAFAGCSADDATDEPTNDPSAATRITTTRISTPNATPTGTTGAATETTQTIGARTTNEEAADPAGSGATVTETPPTTTEARATTTETFATTAAEAATTASTPAEQSGGGSAGGGSVGGGSTGGGSDPTTTATDDAPSSGSAETDPTSTPTEKPLPDPVRSYPFDQRLTVAAGDYELVGFEVGPAQVFSFVLTTAEDRDFDLYGVTAEQVRAYEDQLFSDGGSFEVVDNLTERDSNGEAWSMNEPVTGTYYFVVDNTRTGEATTAGESLTVDVWLRTDPDGN